MYTNFNDLDLSKTYTYADYLLFKFKERVELIRGKIYAMSPTPNVAHQRAATILTGVFYIQFKGSKCQVFTAPFDVRLKATKKKKEHDITTVVQPDLCVYCDETQLDERGGIGAPDLVVEILSPGNTGKEMRLKFDLYEQNGVREYWVVHPLDKNIQIFFLNEGRFISHGYFIEGEQAKSHIFPSLEVPVSELF